MTSGTAKRVTLYTRVSTNVTADDQLGILHRCAMMEIATVSESVE